IFRVLPLFFLQMFILAPLSLGQANVVGEWNTLQYKMPINPVHAGLLHSGKVLVIAGSGGDDVSTNYQAAIWNPSASEIVIHPISWDAFCNGMTFLSDGMAFIDGGTIRYKPSFLGASNAGMFDPATESFLSVPNMSVGRWYPTVITLPDKTVMAFSGINANGITASTTEIFHPSSNSSPPSIKAACAPPLSPTRH